MVLLVYIYMQRQRKKHIWVDITMLYRTSTFSIHCHTEYANIFYGDQQFAQIA